MAGMVAQRAEVAAPDLLAIARRALADSADAERAAQRIVRLAEDDVALAELLIERGAQQAVSSALSERRTAIARNVANPDRATVSGDRGLAALERTSLKGLMAWPLPWVQKPIGDATRAEVQSSLQSIDHERRTHEVNIRFLTLVWQAAKDEKQPIKRQLTPEQLRTFRERAEKASA